MIIAAITAGGLVVSALVSGAVSWFVSSKSVEAEMSAGRSNLFKELMTNVQNSKDPTFAILALWKLFPEDKDLIVSAGLLNPSPSSMATLRAIILETGWTDEQIDQDVSFQRLIRISIENAPTRERSQVAAAYTAFSGQAVLVSLLENVVQSKGAVPEIQRLVGLLSDHPELVADAFRLVASDSKIAVDPFLRARLADALYLFDSTVLSELLNNSENDEAAAWAVIREARACLKIMPPSDQERLVSLAKKLAQKLLSDEASMNNSSALFDFLVAFDRAVGFLPQQRIAFLKDAEALSSKAIKSGNSGLNSLRLLNRLSDERNPIAEKVFYQAIACAGPKEGRAFFEMFPSAELAIANWSNVSSYEDARAESTKRLDQEFDGCRDWVVK